MRAVVLVLAFGVMSAATAAENVCVDGQCGLAPPHPYTKLSSAEYRAKFERHLAEASPAYGRLMAALRGDDLDAAKEAGRRFLQAWDALEAGFRTRPPAGLPKADAWRKWLPVAHTRFGDGVQALLSAGDRAAARREMEGGRWALVRIREENGTPTLADLALRARQASDELRQALSLRRTDGVRAAAGRLRAIAAARVALPDETAKAWHSRIQVAAASPTTANAEAARNGAERLLATLGDRLD